MAFSTTHPRRMAAAAALAFTIAIAGCGKDGPSEFDPAGTRADLEAIDNIYMAPAVVSFDELKFGMAEAMGPGTAGAFALRALPNRIEVRGSASLTEQARAFAAGLQKRSAGTSLKPSLSSASIPAEYEGKTFVFAPAIGWVVDEARTGAPSNGVRFVLYAVDGGGTPDVSQEIGYVDIIENETSTSFSQRIKVVGGSTTYIDYTVAVSGSSAASSFTISVDGFVTDGTDRLTVDLTARANSTSTSMTIEVDYALEVPTRDFSIEIEATLTQTETSGHYTMNTKVSGPNGDVTMSGEMTEAGGSFEVKVNGNDFADITMTAGGDVSVTGADGEALTQDELDVLDYLFSLGQSYDLVDAFGF